MNLNKTTEYAIAIMVFMASEKDDVFSAESLYKKLDIPRRYLRKLLTALSKSGFIRSAKGRKGGFVLARQLGEISIESIIKAVEGPEIMENCILGHHRCNEHEKCLMHEKWTEAKFKMLETLSNITLQELRDKQNTGN